MQPGPDDLILEDPWVGVAICAVISVNVACLEDAKYVVTAHIHVGDKHWKIPVPIHFLMTESENQLVFYWTVADNDLPRTIGWSIKQSCRFSFSVEPEGNSSIWLLHENYLIALNFRTKRTFRMVYCQLMHDWSDYF